MEFLLLLAVLFFGAFALALGVRVAWALTAGFFRWLFSSGAKRKARREKFLSDYILAQQNRAQRRNRH